MELHNQKCPKCGGTKLWHRNTETAHHQTAGDVVLNTFQCLNESCRKVFTETFILVYRGTDCIADPRKDERTPNITGNKQQQTEDKNYENNKS